MSIQDRAVTNAAATIASSLDRLARAQEKANVVSAAEALLRHSMVTSADQLAALKALRGVAGRDR